MRRVLLALVAALAFSSLLSGCPVFTRGSSAPPSVGEPAVEAEPAE